MTITNTIVAGNTATSQGPDIQGTVTSGGHNLIGNTTNTTVSGGSGDLLNVNAQLGTLSSNGGTTQTIPLLAGSPAIGTGDAGVNGCASTGAAGVNKKDQRGFGRSALVCDIGAYETAKTYTVGSTSDGGGAGTLASLPERGEHDVPVAGCDWVCEQRAGHHRVQQQWAGDDLTREHADAGGERDDHGTDERDRGDVDGSSSVTVFTVNSGKTVSLSNLTIQNGGGSSVRHTGGGILNKPWHADRDEQHLLPTIVRASSSFGGGIYNESTARSS